MSEHIPGPSAFFRWLRALPGALAAREHIDLLKTRLALVEKELAEAKALNAKLEQDVGALHEQLGRESVARKFTHERGAEFLKRPGGGYHQAVYCPKCLASARALDSRHVYHCVPCRWSASFGPQQLAGIIAELERRDREHPEG